MPMVHMMYKHNGRGRKKPLGCVSLSVWLAAEEGHEALGPGGARLEGGQRHCADGPRAAGRGVERARVAARLRRGGRGVAGRLPQDGRERHVGHLRRMGGMGEAYPTPRSYQNSVQLTCNTFRPFLWHMMAERDV